MTSSRTALPQRISTETAAHVLYHFGCPEGRGAGSFTRCLIETISRSDPANRARLRQVYPAYVAAVNLAQLSPGGVDKLTAIVTRGQS